MAVNTIQYATIFQKALDKQILAGAASNWMEANAGQVIYNGGNTIKIPKISTDGLGDYDRAKGYTDGAVTLEYETMTLTQDRSRSFILDAQDVDESNFVANASMVMSEFQRLKVIPEIDAYRYSTISNKLMSANKATYGYTPDASTILTTLKQQIAAIKDVTGDIPLVVSISRLVLALIEDYKLEKTLFCCNMPGMGGNIDKIETEVVSIDGTPLLPVPSTRLKTSYVFNDGVTTGQTAGGFVPASNALDANWIITPQNGPIAISKTDKPKIIDPDTNQNADAWKVAYRKYHDIWMTDANIAVSGVCIQQAKPE